MLSIGPGSICDVCLEPFGRGLKSPCSILCGHVFCIECINRLKTSNANHSHPEIDYGAPCPLCRTHFDQRSMIKLHVDIDAAGASAPIKATCLTAAEAEAKRLQDAIASIANEGTTEPRLRQLITDATTFLGSQPRDQFVDLRVSHRMIGYLCDMRVKLRDQRTDYERQLAKLKEDKAELEHKADVVAAARKDERESALVIEMSLREHCARAHKAYEDMVGHYNFVVAEWTKLGEQLTRLRSAETQVFDRDSPSQHLNKLSSPEIGSNVDDGLSLYHDQHMRSSGAAITDSSSFLVSPLPQFTGTFPTVSMNAFPLPDIESESEIISEPRKRATSPPSSCNAHGHPVACPCVEVTPFPELPHSVQLANQPISSRARSASTREPIAQAHSRSSPIPIPEIEHEPRDNGNNKVRRSSSRVKRPHSRSRASTEAPIQSSAPLHVPGSSSKVDSLSSSSSTSAPSTSHSQVYKNNRLQDLLTDTPISMSSSLPNMSLHTPSARREVFQPREKDRSPLLYSSVHPPMLPQDRDYHQGGAPEPMPTRPSFPVPYDHSNTPIPASSVSASGKVLDSAKRERVEKAERERDRQEERYKASRESLEQAESPDQHTWRKAAMRDSSAAKRLGATDIPERLQQGSASSRYALSASSSRDSAHSSSSSSSAYGSVRTSGSQNVRPSGAGSLRGAFAPERHTSNAVPVLSATRA